MTLRMDNQRQTIEVAISSAAAGLSDAIDLGGYRVGGVVMSTGWTAANLTFDVSEDNSTFRPLYTDTGGEITIVAGTSQALAIGPTMAAYLGAFRYIKVRSGAVGTVVAQTTDRTLALVVTPDRI